MTQATKPAWQPPDDPGREEHEGEGLQRQRAWVEVDTAAIAANAGSLRRCLDSRSKLMAVVKADGYGHGAVTVAHAALAGGAQAFGVATLEEGIELRKCGIEVPVLVLGSLTQAEELRGCLRWQLMPTISGMREALLCQNLASGQGRPMPLQLKLDTGMARLGADWQEGPRLVSAIQALEAVQLVGIYSHLASADLPDGNDGGLTRQQQQRFESVLNSLSEQGLEAGCRHLANSAGTLRSRRLHYDMVRVGLALYGQRPADHGGYLRPACRVSRARDGAAAARSWGLPRKPAPSGGALCRFARLPAVELCAHHRHSLRRAPFNRANACDG